MNQPKVKDFLNNYRMDFTDLNFEKICASFLEAMSKGLAGEPSELQMLPTYIQTESEVPVNEPVLVLDAGGTNFRAATVSFNRKGQVSIGNFEKHPMPGVQSEVDKDTLFETMAGYIKELIGNGQKVGFCFSYPVRMFPNRDGRLIAFSKQIKARGVQGELVGENLRLALGRIRANQPGSIVILNDTVATLLAGRAEVEHRNCSGFIGFILGTGTNCCYQEQNSNILKETSSLDPSKSQIINVESGGFNGDFGGVLDHRYDLTTVDPGKYTLEKMISGRYLGGLCQMVIETAANDGLFSKAGSEGLKLLKEVTTIDLNTYLKNGNGDNPLAAALANGSDDDRAILKELIERIIERAAMLAAMTLTAVVLKSGQGSNPEAPVCITAEGSTFYHLEGLKAKTEAYLKQYLTDHYHRYWKLVEIENATLIGAAVAGLTN